VIRNARPTFLPKIGTGSGVKLSEARDAISKDGLSADTAFSVHSSGNQVAYDVSPLVVPDSDYGDVGKQGPTKPGNAKTIRSLLSYGPVVIAMPGTRVKAYRGFPIDWWPTSWTDDLTWKNGVLRNMGDDEEVVPESGHAVCVLAFQASREPDERNGGGWFMFRNSWGSDYCRDAPIYGIAGQDLPRIPARGYGAVSARAVDELCWEWLGIRKGSVNRA
jgi:hypothetical protein